MVAPPSAPPRRVIRLDATLRHHRCEVARYALRTGRPLNLDAITLILAAKQFESVAERRPFTRWTRRGLVGFLWGTASEWATRHGVELPESTAETLWTYLGFLDEQGQLASGSAPLAELRGELEDHAGLTPAGRRNRPAGPAAQLCRLRRGS
jgi:regulator of extracellular matrix RemA (YlzA/DUF370 family)